MILPPPDCEFGYPWSQVADILGNRLPEFKVWMYTQTMSMCDGHRWDYDAHQYVETGCGPHGGITRQSDLRRFLDGQPIID